MKLYKYTSFDSAKKILLSGTMIARHPKYFNDPFDGHLQEILNFDPGQFAHWMGRLANDLLFDTTFDLSRIRDSSLSELLGNLRSDPIQNESLNREKLNDKIKPIIQRISEAESSRVDNDEWRTAMNDMRILCLSETCDIIPMWTHYAEDHTGVVIELSIPIDHEDKFDKVQYVDEYPENIQLAVYRAKYIFDQIQFDSKILYEEQLLTKSNYWRDERERRLIVDAAGDPQDPKFIQVGEITSIYFGCRMSKNHQREMRSILASRYPEINIKIGRPGKHNYNIDFDEN